MLTPEGGAHMPAGLFFSGKGANPWQGQVTFVPVSPP
jgi:hypothetical protein